MFRRITRALAVILPILAVSSANAAPNPPIQLSSYNNVPACVTPSALMEFVRKRNKKLDSRFSKVGNYYQIHGETTGVRWDYAFFQMLVETNYLKYRTSSGRMGDVDPSQNNFAGIGATGGGEPGERFADVSSGVLAHLQHILMYSGQRIDNPVANRTRKVQDWLLPWSQGFARPVTYTDLTKKWSPHDRGYSKDIAATAERFYKVYCKGTSRLPGKEAFREAALKTQGAARKQYNAATSKTEKLDDETTFIGDGKSLVDQQYTAEVGSRKTSSQNNTGSQYQVASDDVQQTASLGGLGQKPELCRVWTARYENGATALLIKSTDQQTVNYTALEVQVGQETAQAHAFIREYAQGGRPIAEFASYDKALNRAFELCPKG